MEYDSTIRKKATPKESAIADSTISSPIFLADRLPRCLRLSHCAEKITGRVLSMNDKFQICRGSEVDLTWRRHETESRCNRYMLRVISEIKKETKQNRSREPYFHSQKWADPGLKFKAGNRLTRSS